MTTTSNSRVEQCQCRSIQSPTSTGFTDDSSSTWRDRSTHGGSGCISGHGSEYQDMDMTDPVLGQVKDMVLQGKELPDNDVFKPLWF